MAALRWAGASVRVVQLGQAALGAAVPLLMFLLARRLGLSRRTAVLAAWIGALYPPFVYFAGRVLSENVAIPLYLLALLLTVEWYSRRDLRWAVLCGAAWGISILGRPTSLPLLPVALVVGLLFFGRRFVLQSLVVLVVAAACVAPWMARNASAVGGAEPVTSNEGLTLWAPNRLDVGPLKSVFRDPKYPGLQDYSVYGRAFPGISSVAQAKGFDFAHASEAAQDRWFRGLALSAVGADPVRFVVRTVQRAGLMMIPAPDNASQTAKTDLLSTVALWVTSGPVVLLGLIGLALLVRRGRDPAMWMLVAMGVVSVGVTAIHLPYVRYRVGGLDPVLIPAVAWLVFRDPRRVSR